MKMNPRLIACGIAMLTGLAVSTVFAAAPANSPPDLFSKSKFAEAKDEAKAAGKLFLVDATATWCGPCKKMDKTTWVDDKVVSWIKDHAIAAQLDVDAEKETAKELRIEAMPTIIVFKDGKEFDRVVGSRTPDELLAWLGDVLQGKRSIDKTIEAAGDRNDPKAKVNVKARMELARTLSRSDKLEEATAEFLWLWDNMVKHDPSYHGVRGSFMASDMKQLADKYPPALEAFTKLRDREKAKMDGGSTKRDVVNDWFTLNRVIDDEDATLAWFDLVKNDKSKSAAIAAVDYLLFDLLIQRGRWADAGRVEEDPVSQAKQWIELYDHDSLEGIKPEYREDLARHNAAEILAKFGQGYACCLAAGRDDEAEEIAELLLHKDDKKKKEGGKPLVEEASNGDAYVALVKWAMKMGQPRQQQLVWLNEAEKQGKKIASLRKSVQEGLEKAQSKEKTGP